MTRAITIVALDSFPGGRRRCHRDPRSCDSVPAAGYALVPSGIRRATIRFLNKQSKQDRLAVAALALAAFEPQQTSRHAERAAAPGLCVDRAGRYRHAEGDRTPQPCAPATPAKPKAVSKPQPQKNYALLSDIQIAGDKGALETFLGAGILLAAGRDRVARGRPQNFTQSGRPIPTPPASRSIPRPKKCSS